MSVCFFHGLALSFVFLLCYPLISRSQNWTTDTVSVPFGLINLENSTFHFNGGKDLRRVPPSLISVFEKKKGLVFPVDQVVITDKPLIEQLNLKFSGKGREMACFYPSIANFEIIQSQSLFKRTFKLSSAIELWEIKTDRDTLLFGTFYHERYFTQKKKSKIEEGYTSIIDAWANSVQGDIIAAQQDVDLLMPGQMYHFRRGKTAINPNLYLSGDFFMGIDFWGIDGELWLSGPELGERFLRTSRILRYQEHPIVRSVALGNNVDLLHYRFSPRCLFTNKNAFLIGFNNWKDMKTASHKFEEIFLFEISATQKVTYNRFDRKGVTAGIGLMESFRYIVHHKPELKIALVVNFALKL